VLSIYKINTLLNEWIKQITTAFSINEIFLKNKKVLYAVCADFNAVLNYDLINTIFLKYNIFLFYYYRLIVWGLLLQLMLQTRIRSLSDKNSLNAVRSNLYRRWVKFAHGLLKNTNASEWAFNPNALQCIPWDYFKTVPSHCDYRKMNRTRWNQKTTDPKAFTLYYMFYSFLLKSRKNLIKNESLFQNSATILWFFMDFLCIVLGCRNLEWFMEKRNSNIAKI
jgi:hypothetical protein